MGFLARRKVTEVAARRVAPAAVPAPGAMPPSVVPGGEPVPPGTVRIEIPRGVSASVGPQPQPPVAAPTPPIHNTVYVNIPGNNGVASAPPPAYSVPPQVYYPPLVALLKRRYRHRSLNLLGIVAALLGTFGVIACFVPALASAALPVAGVGAATGAVGLLTAILFGRSSRGQALGGILVCLVAGGLRLHMTGKLKPTIEQYEKALPTQVSKELSQIQMPKVDLSGLTDQSKATDAVPAAVSKPHQTAKPAAPSVDDVVRQRAEATRARLDSAKKDLATARQEATQRVDGHPDGELQTARAAAYEASTALDQARASAAPGSPEVAAASDRWIQAKSALQRLVNQRVENDPAVLSAQQEMRNAASGVGAP